jgi:hypothetical protein
MGLEGMVEAYWVVPYVLRHHQCHSIVSDNKNDFSLPLYFKNNNNENNTDGKVNVYRLDKYSSAVVLADDIAVILLLLLLLVLFIIVISLMVVVELTYSHIKKIQL